MTTGLYWATFSLTIFTLLPLWRNPHWLVRGWDFPRLQLAVIALVLFIADCIYFDFAQHVSWLVAIITAVCFIWQMGWVLPYLPLWPVEVLTTKNGNNDAQLSIITANVLMTNKEAHLLIDHVRQYKPDILLTLETNEWWEKQLDVLQSEMPHTIKCALNNLYGMHVYSRLPIDEAEISYLVESDVPSIHALLTLRTGDQVRVHFLHPAPPSPTENEESTERDAELIVVAKSIAKSKQAIVVAGDLNDVAWSATTRLFRKISGLLDPRIGRGIFSTFHAKYPFFRWPLDHLFHSKHFTLAKIKRLPSIGSDHFPMLAVLSFDGTAKHQQDGIEADAADVEMANEITSDENLKNEKVPQPGLS
ncbi:MAG: endonuclease/exonuclease/phosphatase family protein [Methylophilaceae bacterium]